MEVACVEVAEAVVAQSYIGEEDAEDDSVEQVEDDVKDWWVSPDFWCKARLWNEPDDSWWQVSPPAGLGVNKRSNRSMEV